MRFSLSLIALSAPYLVSAAPARFTYTKRFTEADATVFKFADVLEQLESQFYQQAIAKFQEADFVAAGFNNLQVPLEQFQQIQQDEADHSVALQAALKAWGQEPITTCTFNFDAGLTDVATMAATARIVENVGVAAYLGGATLLSDPVLLTAAGSILTVEARHQTILNVLSGQGTAIPSAFDIAFTPSEVLALAAPFLAGPCDLGIPANPTLSITNTGTVAPGTLLTFASDALNSTTDGFHCQMLLGGLPHSIALPIDQCIVPTDIPINGPVAIWVTSDSQPLLGNIRDRATAQLIAGPTFAFIDTIPEALGGLTRGSGAGVVVGGGVDVEDDGVEGVDTAVIGAGVDTAIVTDASVTDLSAVTATDSAAITGVTDLAAIATDSAAVAGATATDSAAAAVSGVTDTALTSAATDSAASASVTDSAATSTGTDSAAAATPSAANAAAAALVPGSPGGPSAFTGLSPDGMVTVNGWTNV